jgi:DNA-binding MarR family transcriptional regulator
MNATSQPPAEREKTELHSELVAQCAARLRSIFARSSRRLRHEEQTGLTASQDSALRTILKFGPLTPSELAEHERISRPTASRVVAALHKQRLVELVAAPTDGRSYLVRLSPRGAKVRRIRRERRQSYLSELVADLSADDLDRLAEGLEVLERMFELDD